MQVGEYKKDTNSAAVATGVVPQLATAPSMGGGDRERQQAPGGWEKFFDERFGRPYYYNAAMQQTVWELPEAWRKEEASRVRSRASSGLSVV